LKKKKYIIIYLLNIYIKYIKCLLKINYIILFVYLPSAQMDFKGFPS